jgi:signal transduction histidine kinase
VALSLGLVRVLGTYFFLTLLGVKVHLDSVLSVIGPVADYQRVKILLVDDHAPVRRGLRQLLELKTEYEIVGEGANGMEAVAQVDELDPDIVLMDMNMPIMNGVEATRTIKERHPAVQVLALTAFGEMPLVAAMVKAGAAGYLLKGGSAEELIDSIHAVARGQGALDKEVTRGVMDDMAALYKKEQERADALAELDRMKTEFVAVVSHELRTPLTSIKGSAATLRRNWEDVDDRTRVEFLNSIDGECDRLTSIIEKVLTVSGIQRGGLGLKQSIFSLALVAREALELAGLLAEGREVRLELGDALASGDRQRIRDVAHSLIENALAFTSGAVTVRVNSAGDTPKLSVVDEGPGLGQAKLEHLLERPFIQGDSSSTRRVGGLGLSLYVARQVLETSGGRLDVETGPDRGSTFTMVLPAG